MIVIDGYRIDMATEEDHSHPSEVTKLPVESGADMSDHNRVMNDTVSITGIVSDTPIGDVEALRNIDGASAKPSEEARAHLLKLRDTRLPVTIVTSRAVYESMAMVSFDEKGGVEEAGGLFFTAKFEKQRIATVARVAVAVPRANDQDNLGNRPRKPFNYGQNVFLHLDGFWVDDPDLTVEVNGVADVDIPDDGGSAGIAGTALGLKTFYVWRRYQTYDNETGKNDFKKGPLRDGFMGTDEQIRNHVIKLTPRGRKALFPARHRMSLESEAKERAFERAILNKIRSYPKNGPKVSPGKGP